MVVKEKIGKMTTEHTTNVRKMERSRGEKRMLIEEI